ncbi:MAG: aldo/keto reductase [Kofleriaceae bacterium]|nr:aldo/keto reductase [Kofleriaceae bacterium]
MWSRRQLIAAGLATLVPRVGTPKDHMSDVITRPIPSTKELLPVIGLGSWQTFDVADVAPITPVVDKFLTLGGRVIDSSPMYGRSEAAIGAMLAQIRKAKPNAPTPFLATKVWTSGKDKGIAEMKRSLQRLGVTRLDLMQIHNLLDWKTHLPTLRAWKDAGTIRYIGITHYQESAFDEMERILRTEKLDFVQLPYSVLDRAAEKRLLPAAQAAGAAVLVMEPFERGNVFSQTKGKPLPPVAAELGCTSWAQLALKWIVGHPAVNCPIPATSKVKHVEDNLGALRGAIPTQTQRDAILAAL